MRDPLMSDNPTEREQFERIAHQLTGMPLELARKIAVNLLVNVIRQSVPERKDAEAMINEMFARAKTLLLEQHYDSVTGRRRTVFPFTQVIEAPFHVEEDVIFETKR